MEKIDNKISDFMDKLDRVISDLDTLHRYSTDIYEQLEDYLFDGQEQLIGQLENLFLGATHETATQLAFLKEDIQCLTHFIEFRKKYHFLSETELEQIVDNKIIDMNINLEIKNKLGDSKKYFEVLKSIQQDWQEIFRNTSFIKRNCTNKRSKVWLRY